MNEKLTRVVAVIDQQQSTPENQIACLEGYNNFLTNLSTVTEPCEVSLYTLDGVNVRHRYCLELNAVNPELLRDYSPRTRTGILDAIGYAIRTTQDQIERLNEEDRPSRVVVVVMTDGTETGSAEYSHMHIADSIQMTSQKDDWDFVYLGGASKARVFAESLNFPFGNILEYIPNPAGIRNSLQATALYVNQVRTSELGQSAPSFTDEDRQLAKGNLVQMPTNGSTPTTVDNAQTVTTA